MFKQACWHRCPGGHPWLEGTQAIKHAGHVDLNWYTLEDGLRAVCADVNKGSVELLTLSNTTNRILLPNVTSLPNVQ